MPSNHNVFSYPLSTTMKLSSGSNQCYNRGQDSTAPTVTAAEWLESCEKSTKNFKLKTIQIYGRLEASKMAKILILAPPPSVLKQIFRKTGSVLRIPLKMFTSRNPDKPNSFFLLPSVILKAKRPTFNDQYYHGVT